VGSTVTICVEVTNISSEDWLQRRVAQLNLGNHWLMEDGRTTYVHNDGRSRLAGKLGAGECQIISLNVTAPSSPGLFYLEVDVVQEGMRWFKDAGSPTSLIPIIIVGQPNSYEEERSVSSRISEGLLSLDAVPREPTFTMDGIPKEKVLSVIETFGARLLGTEEHVTEWYSCKYYVRR
jgi:hypothetical protein